MTYMKWLKSVDPKSVVIKQKNNGTSADQYTNFYGKDLVFRMSPYA